MKLLEIFCDGMVLQRGDTTRIFGEGDGCGCIEFLDNKIDFKAENGRFSVALPYLEAGENFDITISPIIIYSHRIITYILYIGKPKISISFC